MSILLYYGALPMFLGQIFFLDYLMGYNIGIISVNILLICIFGFLSCIFNEHKKVNRVLKISVYTYLFSKILIVIILNFIINDNMINNIYEIFKILFNITGTLSSYLTFMSVLIHLQSKKVINGIFKNILYSLTFILSLAFLIINN